MNTYIFLHWIFPIFESAQRTINSATWNNWTDYTLHAAFVFVCRIFIKWRKTEWLTCFKKITRETFFAIFLGTVTHNCANSLDEPASFFFFNLFPKRRIFFSIRQFFILRCLLEDLFTLKLKSIRQNSDLGWVRGGGYSDLGAFVRQWEWQCVELFKLDSNNYLINIASGYNSIHIQFACAKKGNQRKMFLTVLFFALMHKTLKTNYWKEKKSPRYVENILMFLIKRTILNRSHAKQVCLRTLLIHFSIKSFIDVERKLMRFFMVIDKTNRGRCNHESRWLRLKD